MQVCYGVSHARNHDISSQMRCGYVLLGSYRCGIYRCIHPELVAQGDTVTCVYVRDGITQNHAMYAQSGVTQSHAMYVRSGITQNDESYQNGMLGCMRKGASKVVPINLCMYVQRPFSWSHDTSHISGVRSVTTHGDNRSCMRRQNTALSRNRKLFRCIHTNTDTDDDGYLCMHSHLHSNSTWNREISMHVRSQQDNLAILVYNRMLQESAFPDKSTYIFLLSIRCSNARMLRFANQLHSLIPSLEREVQSDVLLGNVLISMYGRCERFDWSEMVFFSMWERNVVSYNAIISLYVQEGQGQQALCLFHQMMQEGIMGNTITFVSTLHACSSESTLRFGMQLHACIVAWASVPDVFLNTALVSMYSKCACIDEAERLFEEMPERNVISWNTMIAAFARHGQGKRVVELFHHLQKVSLMPTVATFVSIISMFSTYRDLLKGKQIHASIIGEILDSNISIGTALINMYRRCGSFSDARRAFDAMCEHDQGSWNAMLTTYVQCNQANEAFQLFTHMQIQGVMPNKTTYSSILSACSFKTALFEGMRLHALVMNTSVRSDLLVCNALVSMYGKCGVLGKAQQVFDKMDERNTVSWNAMLDAHALHGDARRIFELFEGMRRDQVSPDMMSFTSMLAVCSRLGLVDEACDFLVSMSRDYGLVPTRDHFNCVIDILARAGKLDEAESLLNKMPISHCAVSMRTLLGACRSQTDLERGERAAKQVIMLDPKSTSPYTILTTLHAVANQGT